MTADTVSDYIDTFRLGLDRQDSVNSVDVIGAGVRMAGNSAPRRGEGVHIAAGSPLASLRLATACRMSGLRTRSG
jgi:hypothetical protein